MNSTTLDSSITHAVIASADERRRFADRIFRLSVAVHVALTLFCVIAIFSGFGTRIAGDFQPENAVQVLQTRGGLIGAALLGLGLGMVGPKPLEALAQCFARAPVLVRAGLALAAVQLTLELRASDVQPFIYFQF